MTQENETLTASVEVLLDKWDTVKMPDGNLRYVDDRVGELANQAVATLLRNMYKLTPETLEKCQPLINHAMRYNRGRFWLVAKDRDSHPLEVLWAFDNIRRANMLLVWKDRLRFDEKSKECVAVQGLLALEDIDEAMSYSILGLDRLYDILSPHVMDYLGSRFPY